MRLTGVEFEGANKALFSSNLYNPSPTDPYFIKSIVGLDADDISNKFYNRGAFNGESYFEFQIVDRRLVFRFQLNPDYAANMDYADLRQTIYRSLVPNRAGNLQVNFLSGGASVASVEGKVEKLEAAYFSSDPEIQLTIKCNDGMFKAPAQVELSATDLGYDNPIRIADSISNAPHGFEMRGVFTAPRTYFQVREKEVEPEWGLRVVPDGGFESGDVIYFNSNIGERTILVARGGVHTYLNDKLEPGTVWPMIFPGNNEFYFPELNHFTWSWIYYRPTFWGF